MKDKIKEALNWRYAVKMFDPSKKLDDKTIDLLEESLRLSPSSFGLQGWKFWRVDTPSLRKELAEHSHNKNQIENASHLYVLSFKKEYLAEDVESFLKDVAKKTGVDRKNLEGFADMLHGVTKSLTSEQTALFLKPQVYITLGFFLMNCALLKIDAAPLEGFDHNFFDEKLGIAQQGYQSCVLIAAGYRDENDKYAHHPKVRFDKDRVFEIL